MSPIDKLLPRLQGVRRVGAGKWSALSPARDERSPSLSIRELDDGTLLIHDFGGASVDEVLSPIGLDVADLFPPRTAAPGQGTAPTRRPYAAADLIRLCAFESTVACIVIADIVRQREGADVDRLVEAARRLGEASEVLNANR